ncbi:sideroflexin-5-like [Gordionus sp. m RMFG-2023]|uniref:sideroflexin-5-like n=1 Tax=Gordionus sp. m RMFG-2023 TaxID=3053472 RepID=UPI0031FC515D
MLRNNQFNYDMIEIKKAYKYVSANIHPDTNQRIFPLFTMSGFILSGIPIISGMLYFHSNSYSNLLLRSHKTQFLYKSFPIIFFQWLNQTQNALFNFANKNSTMDYSTHMFLSSYLLASFSAVGIAIGLDSIYKRKIKKLKYGKSFNKFIPFVTVALANIVNLISMRYPELKAGIKIMAKDGTILGRSQLASQKALLETSITRVVLPIPILIFPPLIMTYLTNKKLFVKHRNFKFPINVCVITICFTFALPLAIAIFPQISKINKKYLEANWRNVNKNILYNNKAQDILEDSYVYFNRGL